MNCSKLFEIEKKRGGRGKGGKRERRERERENLERRLVGEFATEDGS